AQSLVLLLAHRVARRAITLGLLAAGQRHLHLGLARGLGLFATGRRSALAAVRLIYHAHDPTRTLKSMSIGKRIARMIRAWRGRDASDVTSLKASLDDIHRSQLGQLQNMRRSVADIATSRKRVELRLGGLRQQLD